MRALKLLALSLALTLGTVQKPQAAVAAVAAVAGSGAAGSIAITGLRVAAGGTVMTFVNGLFNGCGDALCTVYMIFGAMVGGVILDEESGEFSFAELDLAKAQELGVDERSISIYNQEIEEANLVLEEVISELNEKSTKEDSANLWEEYSENLSEETFSVMKAITLSL